MSFKSTAANSSRIRKPGIRKLLANPLSPAKPKSRAPAKTQTKDEPLEITEHNIQMDFQLTGSASVVDAMDMIIHNQWAERTLLHSRHFSREAKINNTSPSDLLFSLRGLSMETKADILRYRASQLPPGGIITVNQLYSLYDTRGNTFVDRSLELSVRAGTVRKFVISNASPVISRTGKGGVASAYGSQVTYGYENAEIVVRTESYLAEVLAVESDTPDVRDAMAKFHAFVRENPTALSVTNHEFAAPELSALVKTGFLTLTSNHHHEIDVHQYSIAYPRCGTFLKMINSGRVWLVKALGKTKHGESLEDALFEKWEGKSKTNFRKPFYGYDLLWILADAKGAGVVEAFQTPVGRGWRLTGKL